MTRPPLPRQGPRPLALHLSIMTTTLLSCAAGLPLLRHGWLPSKPALRRQIAALDADAAAVEPEQLIRAIDREIRRRAAAVLTGLERYRSHPYRRSLAEPPVVWAEGTSRLLDYGATVPAIAAGPADRPPVLVVPSLINRFYVLDLAPELSLLRWLAANGVRPLVLDWGRPGPLERRFTLTDYIAGRLERAIAAATAATGRPVILVGYCMGGLLALALAQRRPHEVAGLVVLATPWDFHHDGGGLGRRAAALVEPSLAALAPWGEVPVDVLQALFVHLDPWLAMRKFARFGRLDPASPEATRFVALEDWLNDGVPLAWPVAREAIGGWYGRNEPAVGAWLVAGLPVAPAALALPALVVIPAGDRIVPPASARPLGEALRTASVLTPALGHIGLVASPRAVRSVWQPLAAWLAAPGGGR